MKTDKEPIIYSPARSLVGQTITVPVIVVGTIAETTIMRNDDGSEDTEWRSGQPVASYADAIITDLRRLEVRQMNTKDFERATVLFAEPTRGGAGFWLDLAAAIEGRKRWRRTMCGHTFD